MPLKSSNGFNPCVTIGATTNAPRLFRQFYREYPIQQTVSVELGKADIQFDEFYLLCK